MARFAGLKIDSGPVEATDNLREVPREKWHLLMLERRRFAEVRLSYDCRCLVQFCDDARQMYRELGFTSAERMIRDGYGLEAEEVSLVVEWLRLNPPNEPVSFDAAKAVLNANGGDRRSAEFQVDNIKLKHKGGTDREYVLARLRRDSPHLADEVEAGHLSANAAAIQAGFRKKPTPFEIVAKQLPKLTDEERAKLRAML
jgi:hypothetical protein